MLHTLLVLTAAISLLLGRAEILHRQKCEDVVASKSLRQLGVRLAHFSSLRGFLRTSVLANYFTKQTNVHIDYESPGKGIAPEVFEKNVAAGVPRQRVAQLLSSVRNVHLVVLRGRQVDDDWMSLVSAIPSVESLDAFHATLTQRGLGYIGKMEQLTDLTIESRHIAPNSSLAPLAKLRNLRGFAGLTDAIGDSDIEYLARLPKATFLSLESSRVTADGLAMLSGMPCLEELDLNTCEVSDATLAELSKTPRLRVLRIDASSISLQGLRYFQDSRELKEIILNNSRILDSEIAEVKESMPRVAIINKYWHGVDDDPFKSRK